MRIPLSWLNRIIQDTNDSDYGKNVAWHTKAWHFQSSKGNELLVKAVLTSQGERVLDFEYNPED